MPKQLNALEIKHEVIRIYLEKGGVSQDKGIIDADKILKAMSKKKKFQDQLPSQGRILIIIDEVEKLYEGEQRRLEQPWELRPPDSNGRLPEGIMREDVSNLLDLKRHLANNKGMSPLSIRLARWMSALRLNERNSLALYHQASLYAQRELWAAVTGEKLATSDIDSKPLSAVALQRKYEGR